MNFNININFDKAAIWVAVIAFVILKISQEARKWKRSK